MPWARAHPVTGHSGRSLRSACKGRRVKPRVTGASARMRARRGVAPRCCRRHYEPASVRVGLRCNSRPPACEQDLRRFAAKVCPDDMQPSWPIAGRVAASVPVTTRRRRMLCPVCKTHRHMAIPRGPITASATATGLTTATSTMTAAATARSPTRCWANGSTSDALPIPIDLGTRHRPLRLVPGLRQPDH